VNGVQTSVLRSPGVTLIKAPAASDVSPRLRLVPVVVSGLSWLAVKRSWRLNERHYGALQGLNKKQTADKYGEDKVKLWRRSYDVRPPGLEPSDERHPLHDPRYSTLPPELLPSTECLKDVVERMLPYWYD